ncbi:MAG: hypothetical protein ACE5FF_14030 [Saprospiraceae bacterium]
MKNLTSVLFLVFTFSIVNATSSLQPETRNPGPETLASFTPPRWEKLGQRKVNYALDRDEIMVTAREGRFTALKFKVRKGGINMHKMVVHYRNGGKQEIELRNRIPAGGESRVINLKGNKRIITKVVFWYDTKNFSMRRGTLELWGRH